MDYNKAALKMHEENKGKIGVVSKVAVKTRDDLQLTHQELQNLAERSEMTKKKFTDTQPKEI